MFKKDQNSSRSFNNVREGLKKIQQVFSRLGSQLKRLSKDSFSFGLKSMLINVIASKF